MPMRVVGDASQTGIMRSDVFRAWLVHTTLVYLLMQMNVNKIIPTLLESPCASTPDGCAANKFRNCDRGGRVIEAVLGL